MTRSQWKMTAVAVLGLLCFILGFQNTGRAEIQVLFWSFSLPLVLLIGICLVLGLLIGWILASRKKGKPKQKPESAPPEPVKTKDDEEETSQGAGS